jgi:predicted GH43/DUF377 family glycosyl hydrolase
MRSHASNPVALTLPGGLVRVYFSSRDERNRSHVGFLEFDPAEPDRIHRLSDEPVLAPGPLGYFDDHGTYALAIVEHQGRLLMYYVGWNPGPPPLYYPSIGLAVSHDGGERFERYSRAPIMARSELDPWMVTAPFVLLDEGRWRMWYVSGIGWREEDGELHSFYQTKYAESEDGVNWQRTGRVALELGEGERNIARLCVVRDSDCYRGWYSYTAGGGYLIGYAESDDGLDWVRSDDEARIGPSGSGWDSEATAYPYVFDFGGRRYMLYCGNDVGRTGFGLAEAA